MYKQSPSRNNRSKGIKVKHILQICVLVAVCFWLLYQFKRSHEKRKEFESNDENSVAKLQSDSELHRFGRKDIPRVTEIANNVEKHEEDEDDKEDEEDKDNKPEEDEIEREDARYAEIEEERGGGDDEIDEHELEKTEDEEADEDKEREEKESATDENRSENEEHEDTHEEGHPEEEEESWKEYHTESEENDDADKEDHGEREITSNYHDRDVEKNTREAQEEIYRADDASSEVAQNVQSITQVNGNVSMGQVNEIYGKISFGQEHESKSSKNVDELVKSNIQLKEDFSSTASNATITELKNDKVNLTMADDDLLQYSTLPEIPNNLTVGEKSAVTLLSNGTQITLDSDLSHDGTVGIKQSTFGNDHKVAIEDDNNIENLKTNKTFSSSGATNDNEPVEAAKDSLVDDGSQAEKSDNVRKAGTDEHSESRSSEGRETIQHDPIDASDTAIFTQEEKESSTDLDMLPDIRSEVHDTEDSVAE